MKINIKNWRINLIVLLFFVFWAAIVGRLIFLQLLNREFYGALAKGQQKVFGVEIGERGEIFVQDKNGKLYRIATNKDWPLAYVSPRDEKIPENELKSLSGRLAEILSQSQNTILEKLKSNNFYEVLKTKLTNTEIEKLKQVDSAIIHVGKQRSRYYPQEDFLSQVLGFVGGQEIGQYGIEEYREGILRGEEKSIESERSAAGFLFLKAPEKGSDLILTIDYNIQYQAEKILRAARENLGIESGEIIVMDPVTGKILALANFPGFDPNQYETFAQRGELDVFKNSAIQSIFEPGSVFKPLVMAAALAEGKITPQTTYIDEGFVKIGGRTVYNYDGRVWGKRTMTEVLEKSINTGAVFAQSQISHQTFLNYIKKFGIFEKTNIDLPGEISSQNKEFQKGYEINFATAAFGQGIEMTPLQLTRAFAAISNGGNLVKPYVVEKIIKNGSVQNDAASTPLQPESNKIISSDVLTKLTAMLVSVTENGFGKAARVPGYYIAGKTGTAQVPWSAMDIARSGYSDKTIQSFIGFFPAFKPKVLILVKLNNPSTKTAEYSAIPAFQELAKYIIDYYQIPPDYE